MKKTMVALSAFGLLITGLAAPVLADSESNRGDSILFLGTTPWGVHGPTILASPFFKTKDPKAKVKSDGGSSINTVGMYLGDSWLVGLQMGTGKLTYEDAKTSGAITETAKSTMDFTTTGAYVRWFPGNSFNVLLSVDNREFALKGGYVATDGVNAIKSTVDMKTTSQVATLGLGNQWNTDFHLVIGVDWAVVSALMSNKTDFTVSGSGSVNGTPVALTAAEKKAMEDDVKQFGTDLGKFSSFPGALIVTLGLAF